MNLIDRKIYSLPAFLRPGKFILVLALSFSGCTTDNLQIKENGFVKNKMESIYFGSPEIEEKASPNETLVKSDTGYKWVQTTSFLVSFCDFGFKIFLLDINRNGNFNDHDIDKIGIMSRDQTEFNDLNQYQLQTLTSGLVIGVNDHLLNVSAIEPNGWFTLTECEPQKRPDIRFYTTWPSVYLQNFSSPDSILIESTRNTSGYTYLEFWGTWCPGCVSSLPLLDSIKALGTVKVVHTNFGDEEDTALSFLKSHPQIQDTHFIDMQTLKKLGIHTFPGGILFDDSGHIIMYNASRQEIFDAIKTFNM